MYVRYFQETTKLYGNCDLYKIFDGKNPMPVVDEAYHFFKGSGHHILWVPFKKNI